MPTTPGPLPATITSAVPTATAARERGRYAHCLEVATECVPGGDGDVEETVGAQAVHAVAERERQGGSVGHHVRDAGLGAGSAHRKHHRGQLAVQAAHHDHPAAEVRERGHRLGVIFLDRSGVDLQAGVAQPS